MSEIEQIHNECCGYYGDCHYAMTDNCLIETQLQQLKQENEELETQLQQYIDLCKQKTVDIFEMADKLEKIKNKIKYFGIGYYKTETIEEYQKCVIADYHKLIKDILQIIESKNVPNNNQQSNR